MNNIFISNCCLGNFVKKTLSDCEHNNPFMDTLIPEDTNFLKLCENIFYYMKCQPTCDYQPSNTTEYSKQVNDVWYNNPAVIVPYPIIHLDDIEIHCIHESSISETLEAFSRRMERFNTIISSGHYKIFCIMTWTNLFTIHKDNDYKPFIKNFLINKNINNNITNIFFGPVNLIDDRYYVGNDMFEMDITRRADNVNTKISFDHERDMIVDYLKNSNLLIT